MTMSYHEEHFLDRAAMLAMRGLIALQPKSEFGPDARPGFDTLMEKTPAADGVTYEAATIGGIAGWWCRPVDPIAGAAILYLHGGAYVVGSARAYRHFAGQIAARASAATFVADYGLAPERPFPAAYIDAQAAYRGLIASGLTRIALAGDSAGGGLALALVGTQSSKEGTDEVPAPAAVAVMSPWIDLLLAGDSMRSKASSDPLLSLEALSVAARLYLGDKQPRDPRASALYGDLKSVPPIFLHVGEDEVLLDDARRYATKVEDIGGSAELHVWQGMVHVFPANLALLRAAREALGLIGGFLRAHLVGEMPSSHSPSQHSWSELPTALVAEAKRRN
jgi:monoterpene epsilon-lactone hydrolase